MNEMEKAFFSKKSYSKAFLFVFIHVPLITVYAIENKIRQISHKVKVNEKLQHNEIVSTILAKTTKQRLFQSNDSRRDELHTKLMLILHLVDFILINIV